MIKAVASDDKFSKPMTAEQLKACLDQYLDSSWRCCTPEELIRKSLEYFNLTMNVPYKGVANSQAPIFIVYSKVVTLYISNRHTVCGKKQMLYFFLEYILTGKIAKEADKYLFTIDNHNFVISCMQDPNRIYKMTEIPGLDINAETLLSILSNART